MKNITLIILVFCSLLFTAACDRKPKVEIFGKTAPDFSLVDRQGKTWTLSGLKGQVVVLYFWSSWCPPCREDLPAMQRLDSRLPKDKYKMLAILNRDKPEVAYKFADKLGITVPILYDRNDDVGQKYGVIGLPVTFIVDKQGVLKEKILLSARRDSAENIQMLMEYINQ